MPPARVPQDAGYGDRRRERDDRRRSQAQGSNVVPPSPALVRHGSKQRKIPAALTPGQFTAQPPQAHIPIGVNNNNNNNNRANVDTYRANGQHPYAVAGIGAGYEYAQYTQHDGPYKSQPYGRTSSMAQVAVSKVRAMGGEAGVSQDYHGPDLDGLNDDDQIKPSFLRILTCRC